MSEIEKYIFYNVSESDMNLFSMPDFDITKKNGQLLWDEKLRDLREFVFIFEQHVRFWNEKLTIGHSVDLKSIIVTDYANTKFFFL